MLLAIVGPKALLLESVLRFPIIAMFPQRNRTWPHGGEKSRSVRE